MKKGRAVFVWLGLACSLTLWASDNSKSKSCPGEFVGPPPPPPGPGWILGYGGQTWVRGNQDPGAVVDVSQQTIAAPIMAAAGAWNAPALFTGLSATSSSLAATSGVVTVTAPAVYTALGPAAVNGVVAVSIDSGAAAGAGGGVIVEGVPGGLNQIAIAIYNYALNGSAAPMILDFTSQEAAAASSQFIRICAANALKGIVASGVVPAGWMVNGIPMTLDQLKLLFQDLQPWFGNAQPGSDVAVNSTNDYTVDANGNVVPTTSSLLPATNPAPVDPSGAVANASLDGGGAADGGDLASAIGAGCGG